MPTQIPGPQKADDGDTKKSKIHNCDGKIKQNQTSRMSERIRQDRSEHFQFTKRQNLGSSMITSIKTHEMLVDIEIQAYSESTSEEKLANLSKCEKKKLKRVTIQDGTNSVLKHTNEAVEEIFQHHQDLIKQIEANHEPQKLFFCKIPPINDSEELSGCNEKIDAFNHKLNQHYEHNERYQLIQLNGLVASKKNMTACHHKIIHLNDALGTPFPKNLFLSSLLTHSDSIHRVGKSAYMSDPRDNIVSAKTKILNSKNEKPCCSPKKSNYDYNSNPSNYMHQNDTQFGHTNPTYKYLSGAH